jgi:predicted secreted protein
VDLFGIFVVFVIFWWIGFFIALPFGVKTTDAPEPGHAASAPIRPRLWIKAAFATVVASLVTGAFYGVVDAGWLSLETFAE